MRILEGGGIVALPTETVYGLAAVVDNEEALREIFRVKGRPADNPMIVHVATLEQAAKVAVFNEVAARLAAACWPGPLTLVLPRQQGLSDTVTAGLDTVAVRMPDHPVFNEVLRRVGKPLAAPSANRSGRPSPTLAMHVAEDHEGRVKVVEGGATRVGLESTVARPQDDRIILLRPGAITREQLADLGGVDVENAEEGDEMRSPGTRYRHYAPRTPVRLVDSISLPGDSTVAILSSEEPELSVPWRKLTPETLYADLRWADSLQVDEILVHCDRASLHNEALMNRLRHAAGTGLKDDVGT